MEVLTREDMISEIRNLYHNKNIAPEMYQYVASVDILSDDVLQKVYGMFKYIQEHSKKETYKQ